MELTIGQDGSSLEKSTFNTDLANWSSNLKEKYRYEFVLAIWYYLYSIDSLHHYANAIDTALLGTSLDELVARGISFEGIKRARKTYGDPQPRKLSEKPWLNFRQGRRWQSHPRSRDTNKPLPLVNTSISKSIAAAISQKKVNHILVEGDIATGKSCIIEQAIEAWKRKHPDGYVTVLPMGGDYASDGRWQTAPAFDAFQSQAVLASEDGRRAHLLVIEDCHEFHIQYRNRYTFKNTVDLSTVSLICSSRPSYAERVVGDIENWAGVTLSTMKTDVDATASLLIKRATPSADRQADLKRVFIELGSNLIALGAVLFELSRTADHDHIGPSLAYRTIFEEVERIFDPDGDHVNLADSGILKLGLLAIWMLGAVECNFTVRDLARLLNIEDVAPLIRSFEATKEVVAIDEDGHYRSTRHPAWGQLTMRAIDTSEWLEVYSTGLRQRMMAATNISNAETLPKSLQAFLFALLYQKICTIEFLGLMATGRHMHDEFAFASRKFVEVGRDRTAPITKSDRLDILIETISSVRRSNPQHVGKRQDLIREAIELSQQAVALALEDAPIKGKASLPSRLLYEVGYVEYLSGNFLAASKTFASYKTREFSTAGHEHFGIMAGAKESMMLTYLGKYDQAEACLAGFDDILARLRQSDGADKQALARFQVAYLQALIELAIAREQPTQAAELVDQYYAASAQTNAVNDRGLYDARICLMNKDYETALRIAEKSCALQRNLGSAEFYHASYRILGGSLLGLGRTEEARQAYQKIVGTEEGGDKFRDFDMELANQRLDLFHANSDVNIFNKIKF